ncbi:BON domain-containing protein [Cereibacter sphaeroides]|uniref:BON domain-containing protein n=1 Tax=Cereibacter sphaeroides TaxID=1063 RepID=UPI000F537934|nr:BON domain-containing protein [Cereibacter sphaeroides]AZB55534.1 BON domain-containing protein [Cereibacter sphaeroides]AZB59793.1 BON domain-containing protein [Cereibacter sphaeroides]
MAQSRFDARNRNWDEDADMQRYGGDRSRGNREDDPRMRGGPEDRNRDRFDARYQDRGQDEARGAERDRSSGGGMDAASGYGFGAAGFDPRDRDDRRGGSDRSDRDYGSERRSQDERSWGYGPQIGREWDRRGQSYDERHGRGGPRFYDSAGERGFMDRAADEVMSWMGDDEAGRRREEDHRGKGPRGYQRSDTRIHDDVNDRLSDDPRLDASDIDVSVAGGEVTLNGHVSTKMDKRRAEDCADTVSGVRHVQNNLRVRENGTGGSGTAPLGGSSSGKSGSGISGSGGTDAGLGDQSGKRGTQA